MSALPIGEIITGDCLEVMREWPDGCVDCCICDPPYGLGQCTPAQVTACLTAWLAGETYKPSGGGFMGKEWDSWVPGPELWREIHRVLRDGGRAFVFAGSRTQDLMGISLRLAGFTCEETIAWIFGSGFPKHKSKLKPAMEPIIIARKGKVSLLNIDAARIDPVGYSNGGQNRTVAFNTQGLGEKQPRCDGSAGRWPANVCMDGGYEGSAAAMLDEQSGTLTSGMMNPGQQRQSSRGGGGYHGNMPDEATADGTYGDSGGASRFYYCAKASASERNSGLSGMPERDKPTLNEYQRPSEGRTAPKNGSPAANHHPTVKPLALMRWLVRLATFPGELVLDPFAGSGTTLLAAQNEQRPWIGIELNEAYCAIARKRTAQKGLPL